MNDEAQAQLELQWGKACRPTKGQDRIFAHWLRDRHALLVGVADGVSSGDGETAATWLEEAIGRIAYNANHAFNIHELFAQLKEELKKISPIVAKGTVSQSTLSCGICEAFPNDRICAFRFDFFAVGDSPIWRVARIANGGELHFQANVVYAGALPAEIGRLYSYVNVSAGEIIGNVHFGSVEIADDELLIVASDGIPEWQIFAHDQDEQHGADSPKLVELAFAETVLNDGFVKRVLSEYDAKRLLIDDDASIVLVKSVGRSLIKSDLIKSPVLQNAASSWSKRRKIVRDQKREFHRTKHRKCRKWQR